MHGKKIQCYACDTDLLLSAHENPQLSGINLVGIVRFKKQIQLLTCFAFIRYLCNTNLFTHLFCDRLSFFPNLFILMCVYRSYYMRDIKEDINLFQMSCVWSEDINAKYINNSLHLCLTKSFSLFCNCHLKLCTYIQLLVISCVDECFISTTVHPYLYDICLASYFLHFSFSCINLQTVQYLHIIYFGHCNNRACQITLFILVTKLIL